MLGVLVPSPIHQVSHIPFRHSQPKLEGLKALAVVFSRKVPVIAYFSLTSTKVLLPVSLRIVDTPPHRSSDEQLPLASCQRFSIALIGTPYTLIF